VPIPFGSELCLGVSVDELLGLVADPSSYVEVEPRLVRARWVTPGAISVGSMAELVLDIPFTLPAVRRAFGLISGLMTVTDWEPPRLLSAQFESRAVAVRAEVHIEQVGGVEVASFRGELVPHQRVPAMISRPFRPLLAMLMNRSMERGLRRAEAGLVARERVRAELPGGWVER
jgi:hypothetical protein